MTLAEGCSRSGGRPFALVWSPIPLISWLMPFIGHIGVCSSTGRTFDFAGPFTVNEDRLLFGKPIRFLQLNPGQATKGGRRAAAPGAEESSARGRPDPESGDAAMQDTGAGLKDAAAASDPAAAAAQSWDQRLYFAAATYRLMNYNLMTTNCHCFVAHTLNQLGYRGGGWDMVSLAALVFIRGRYASRAGVAYTWLPWLLLVSLGGYFGGLRFAFAYATLCAPLLAWFLLYTWCCWRDLSF